MYLPVSLIQVSARILAPGETLEGSEPHELPQGRGRILQLEPDIVSARRMGMRSGESFTAVCGD